MERQGGHGSVRLGVVSSGQVRRLRYGRVCCVLVGQVRQVKAVEVGMAWRGQAKQGLAVSVWSGLLGLHEAGQL